jgi:hypothetical protein
MADTEALGLSARARAEFKIPKGVDAPTYVLPPGHLVRADSLAVSSGGEKWRLSPDGDMRRQTYRDLYGRGVLFSPNDAGRRVVIEYEYLPTRVGLVRPVNASDLDYLGSYLEQLLIERLTEWGFSVASPEETQLAIASGRVGLHPDAVVAGYGTQPTAAQVNRLAQTLRAEYVLVSGVENIWGGSLALRTTLVLFDGDTGEELLRANREASEPLRRGWRGFLQSTRKARKSLIRVTVGEILADHFLYRP